eukprot:scaffold187869_cov25-Attheya_sp.AAC.1
MATTTSSTLTTAAADPITPSKTALLVNPLLQAASEKTHGNNKPGKLFVLPRRSSEEITIAQLRQELASTKDNLETKSNHCHDLTLKLSNLTKIRDTEAHNGDTAKDRARQLEDTMAHLNETMHSPKILC